MRPHRAGATPARRAAAHLRSGGQTDAFPPHRRRRRADASLAWRPPGHDGRSPSSPVRPAGRQSGSSDPRPTDSSRCGRSRTVPGVFRSAHVWPDTLPRWIQCSRLVVRHRTRRDFGSIHDDRCMRFLATPGPRPGQGRPAQSGTFPRHRQLDGRRDPLAGGNPSRQALRRAVPARSAKAAPRDGLGGHPGACPHGRNLCRPARRLALCPPLDGRRCLPAHQKTTRPGTIGGRTTCWSPARQKPAQAPG